MVVLLLPPLIQIRWTTILCEETPGNGIFNVHSNELFSQGPLFDLTCFCLNGHSTSLLPLLLLLLLSRLPSRPPSARVDNLCEHWITLPAATNVCRPLSEEKTSVHNSCRSLSSSCCTSSSDGKTTTRRQSR